MLKHNILWYLFLFLFFLLTICTLKIAFCGIKVKTDSIEVYFRNDLKLDENSQVKIKSSDFDVIHDEPILIHIESTDEYNQRIKRAIQYFEHKN